MKNIFKLPDLPIDDEQFDTLFEKNNVKIERIVSTGQVSPDGFWFDQDRDEWVILLEGEAELEFEDGNIVRLKKGEHVFCPKELKHRVTYTSMEPACVWLAVHF